MEKDEFLTPEELTTLTGEKKNPNKIRWLQEHGWNHVVSNTGFPVVSRIYCRQKLSDSVPEAPVYPVQPNFAALLA